MKLPIYLEPHAVSLEQTAVSGILNRRAENQRPSISIVIPTLNEEGSIGRTLDGLATLSDPVEVVVVDGGSLDRTVEIVRAHGASSIVSERGRGAQMHAGACASRGDVLWFLHADTLPPQDAATQIAESLRDPRLVGGSFDVHFDSRRFSARFLSWFYRRLRRLGVCYGDSAIFVRRETYELAGGFKPFAIFEDVDLVRRLRRFGGMARVPAAVTTSARRFEGGSFVFTFARWTLLQVLYWAGINPQILNRLYGPIREPEL